MPASNFFGAIQKGTEFARQREQDKFQRQQNFIKLDDQRKGALFQDARMVNSFIKAGQPERALDVLSQRASAIEQFGGDGGDSAEIADFITRGDFQGATDLLDSVEDAGVGAGFLSDPLGRELTQAKLDNLRGAGGVKPVSVQSSKILDDGSVIEVLKGGGRQVISTTGDILTGEAARDAVKVSRDQAFNRKKELARLAQTIKREQSREGLLTDQQTAIQRSNIKRLGTLSGTSSGRVSSIKKAAKFMLALEKGEASSGASRKGASFIPGVFTSQGQFDEEFNAFSEVAARQQLKASGETRPTDADVQGMKQAMFGIGRDKTVNIQLLSDFITDQNAQNNELDQLIEASRGGTLSEFTFTPVQAAPLDVGSISDEDLFK